MRNLPLIIHSFQMLAMESGETQLVPTVDWEHLPVQLHDDSLLYDREQTMPLAPFRSDFSKRIVRIDEFPTSENKVSLASFKSYGRELSEELGFYDIPTTLDRAMSAK